MKRILVILILISHAVFVLSQDFGNEMFSLTQIKSGVKSKRISSYDKTGGNEDRLRHIQDGEKVTLMNVKGTGIINHIWITVLPDRHISRNDIILRMYWDGNSFPSVEAPLGSFFGNGWNEFYNFLSAPLSCAPERAKSLVCYFAMPFANGARIEIENQTGKEMDKFYYYIDYYEMDQLPENSGRFHAWFNHETTPTQPISVKNKDGKNNYLIADIKGKGHFAGVNYYITNPTLGWYGEGDDMIFLDGDTLHGTGTEDFFNTAWSPEDLFQHPYFGYPRVNRDINHFGRTHMYRFFITDPIYFEKSCKLTIEHGSNNSLTLDLASVAYWYQEKAGRLPRSLTKEERQPKHLFDYHQIENWRKAWRETMGNDSLLWGDETLEK